jgi:hypothetical protein
MTPTKAALGALALLALLAWIVDQERTRPADSGDGAAFSSDLARVSSKLGSDAKRGVIEAAQRLASPAVESAVDGGQYVGDFYRMMVAYDGFGPAKAALDELCATQAPGLILAVYRPGDVERDAWCVARYGDADEFLDTATSTGEQPAPQR